MEGTRGKKRKNRISYHIRSDQISRSVVSDSATPWIAACQASLSITNSRSSLRLTSIESVMPSSHLILCRPLLLLPPIPPSIRVFSNESILRRRTPNTGSSGRLSPLNNQDRSRQGTHIKFLLVLSPCIMMQHDPMLITSSVKGSGLTALYGSSHCILATILQDRGGNWGSKRLSNQLKVTHLTRSRTGAWNLALLTPEIKLLA